MAWPPADVIRLALTALLASIPVALPATFTLSAAIGAQRMARHGVLLTRLSAAHEAAAMDVLCADKTGTLTRNALEVEDVSPMPGFDRARVLALAARASSEADQDPIDAAIRRAAADSGSGDTAGRLVRFVPFDPATKMAEAVAIDQHGTELRIVKGALQAIAEIADISAEARRLADDLAAEGHRVIAVAAGPPTSPHLAGLIALSDPPREDAARLIAALRDMGVQTVMVTGDSPVTAVAIARKVGIAEGCALRNGSPRRSAATSSAYSPASHQTRSIGWSRPCSRRAASSACVAMAPTTPPPCGRRRSGSPCPPPPMSRRRRPGRC